MFLLNKKAPSNRKGPFPVNYSLTTLIALGPFGPFSVSKLTASPSARDLNPSPWMDVWCTKASLPSSHEIKPKPLLSLNHFFYLLIYKLKSQKVSTIKKGLKDQKIFVASSTTKTSKTPV
jgi:hypothetical protein